MVTIRDVAQSAGVSTATVSRVFSGADRVSDAARQRVTAAAEVLGYRPHAVARSLRAESTGTIGLVVGDVLNPFFTELARAVEDAARERGLRVILGNADERPDLQDEYIGELLARRVDGLLVAPAGELSPVLAEAVRRRSPLVLVDRELPGVDVPVVRVDSRPVIDELVGHLVSLGHERIAVIAGPQQTSSGRERLAAFREGCARHGVELPESYVTWGDFRLDSGRAAMERLLGLPRPPQVVFAADNLMTLGALLSMRKHGLRCPEDVGIVSFDDVPWFEAMSPTVTAIAQPTAELGRRAVDVLIKVLAGHPSESVLLSASLRVRESSGGRRQDG